MDPDSHRWNSIDDKGIGYITTAKAFVTAVELMPPDPETSAIIAAVILPFIHSLHVDKNNLQFTLIRL